MEYNFNEHIDRHNTNSAKWDNVEVTFNGKDLLPMWVADTDFRVPHGVIEEIQKRLEHPIFGYTLPEDEVYDVIVEYVKDMYDWDIKKEWILFTNGVVAACHIAVRAFVNPGDEVIIQSPVYYPFQKLIKANGMCVADNPLVRKDDQYYMDFDHMRSLFKTTTGFGAKISRVKAAILCNPHNPVGRVWTEAELKEYADICVENDALIISDDIHCDLLLNDNKHTMLPAIDKKYEKNSITIIAPSKTFNLAGLKAAITIIPDDKMRADFAYMQMAGYNSPNLLALAGLKAAYKNGKQYIEELNNHVSKNLEYFIDYINENIPEITVIKPEGTYLVWVDMNGLGMETQELNRFMIEKVKVATDFGNVFGEKGAGYQRFNLGCTFDTVKECLKRLDEAITEWRQSK